MKEKNDYLKVNNAKELLHALKNKESHILIGGDFKKEFVENTQLPLSENERMGFDLGFQGTAGIWSEIFYQIINVAGKGSKQQKKIDSKIRNYNLNKLNENEILLSLRQLEY